MSQYFIESSEVAVLQFGINMDPSMTNERRLPKSC